MSEPVKKPGKNPESFSPKKPEIVNMMDKAKNTNKNELYGGIAMFEKFEIVKCGPFRFIGVSTYLRNKGSHGMHDNIWSYLWSKSSGVFAALDEMKEYATDEVHDCVLYHWEKYCDKTEAYGYTIGRLMKAGAPVPQNMEYIDIPCDYIAKVFKKRKHDYDERIKGEDGLIKLEGAIDKELKRHWQTDDVKEGLGGLFLTAEVYPKPDENGDTYIGCYEFGKSEN